jgi:diguanylate cyclase (GGDEF)-like protein
MGPTSTMSRKVGASTAGLSQELEFPARILIVEDDRMIRLMLTKTFERDSEVIVAEDGREGLEKMQQARPDFVVTDLMLPEVDGLTLITRARRTYFGACVPILMLTASSGEQILLECFRQGADDFMVKPFSVSELRTRVSSIHIRQRVARDVNPLTRLPGNLVIKQQVQQRLASGAPFAVAYLDIDHFKAFNDSRGFDSGDEVLKLVSDLLVAYTLENPSEEIFVGHVGGDDFVILLHPNLVDKFGTTILARFPERVRKFYSDDELARQRVTIVNRHGEQEEVPLLSLSIGVVSTERSGVDDFRKIIHVSAEVKKQAKALPGNSLFVDRRLGPIE